MCACARTRRGEAALCRSPGSCDTEAGGALTMALAVLGLEPPQLPNSVSKRVDEFLS